MVEFMQIMEDIVFTTNYEILDADCKKGDVIALLKGKGENLVHLNGETILRLPTGHSMIRWTENHFCLLRGPILSFYTPTGELMDEMEAGRRKETNVFRHFLDVEYPCVCVCSRSMHPQF